MAKVNSVKKSRKENVCSCCKKVIPVGSPYKWISFNFGPTIVRCNSCGFKPYETTANEYGQQVGKIVYDFENDIDKTDTLEELESFRDDMVSSLEEVKDELDDKKSNLPDQFQEAGPGEIITERIDNLEDVISELGDVDFDFEYLEDVDLSEMIDKVVELEELEESDVAHLRTDEEIDEVESDWTEEKVRERYQEWCYELQEEKLDELKEELTEAVSNLNY